uniref:Transmembrane protein n=1 Tax=Macrostomum lignano TaxID=282301 RepID=A0A1I8HYS7_9PLAT
MSATAASANPGFRWATSLWSFILALLSFSSECLHTLVLADVLNTWLSGRCVGCHQRLRSLLDRWWPLMMLFSAVLALSSLPLFSAFAAYSALLCWQPAWLSGILFLTAAILTFLNLAICADCLSAVAFTATSGALRLCGGRPISFHDLLRVGGEGLRVWWLPAFCLGMAGLQLPLSTSAGFHLVELLDAYGIAWSVALLCLMELATVSWVFGVQQFSAIIKIMLRGNLSLWWKVCWTVLSPAALIANLVIKWFKKPNEVGLPLPSWTINASYVLEFLPLLPLPVCIVYYLVFTAKGSFSQRLTALVAINKSMFNGEEFNKQVYGHRTTDDPIAESTAGPSAVTEGADERSAGATADDADGSGGGASSTPNGKINHRRLTSKRRVSIYGNEFAIRMDSTSSKMQFSRLSGQQQPLSTVHSLASTSSSARRAYNKSSSSAGSGSRKLDLKGMMAAQRNSAVLPLVSLAISGGGGGGGGSSVKNSESAGACGQCRAQTSKPQQKRLRSPLRRHWRTQAFRPARHAETARHKRSSLEKGETDEVPSREDSDSHSVTRRCSRRQRLYSERWPRHTNQIQSRKPDSRKGCCKADTESRLQYTMSGSISRRLTKSSKATQWQRLGAFRMYCTRPGWSITTGSGCRHSSQCCFFDRPSQRVRQCRWRLPTVPWQAQRRRSGPDEAPSRQIRQTGVSCSALPHRTAKLRHGVRLRRSLSSNAVSKNFGCALRHRIALRHRCRWYRRLGRKLTDRGRLAHLVHVPVCVSAVIEPAREVGRTRTVRDCRRSPASVSREVSRQHRVADINAAVVRDSIGEQLLLQAGVPRVPDHQVSEHVADAGSGSGYADRGSAGANVLGGLVDVATDGARVQAGCRGGAAQKQRAGQREGAAGRADCKALHGDWLAAAGGCGNGSGLKWDLLRTLNSLLENSCCLRLGFLAYPITRFPNTLPMPAPDPATPTVAAPAPMYLAAWSMSRRTALECRLAAGAARLRNSGRDSARARLVVRTARHCMATGWLLLGAAGTVRLWLLASYHARQLASDPINFISGQLHLGVAFSGSLGQVFAQRRRRHSRLRRRRRPGQRGEQAINKAASGIVQPIASGPANIQQLGQLLGGLSCRLLCLSGQALPVLQLAALNLLTVLQGSKLLSGLLSALLSIGGLPDHFR